MVPKARKKPRSRHPNCRFCHDSFGGFDIDYKRLLKEFRARGELLRAFYYTAVIEDQEFSSIRPLVDWLDYNGFTVVTKATKEFVDSSGRRKVKGNMDIELAVDGWSWLRILTFSFLRRR